MSKRHILHIQPRLMKAREAAAYIGTSVTNLYRLVDRGELAPPLIRGGERVWDIRDLDEHAENLSRSGEPTVGDWSGVAI